MAKVDLHSKSDQDLHKLLTETNKRLRQFRFDLAGGKVTQVKEGRNLRRRQAAILTILNQRSRKDTNNSNN